MLRNAYNALLKQNKTHIKTEDDGKFSSMKVFVHELMD